MWVYSLLLVILICLTVYYQYLVSEKNILTEHYIANTVVDSYDKYRKYIDNETIRNESLEERLKNNNYGQFYEAQLNNFKNLFDETKGIADIVRERSEILLTKASEHNNMIENDRKNFIDNERNRIVKSYKDDIDVSFEDPSIKNKKINDSIDRVINKEINPMLNQYVKGLPNNDKVVTDINNVYNEGLDYTKSKISGMTLAFNKNIDDVVNVAIENKIKTLPSIDLSKSNGVLVRLFDASRPNSIGSMRNEYILPSISYYMTQNNQALLSTQRNNINKTGPNRYIEFIGTIKLPADVKEVAFMVESGSGVRFYFGSQIQIDNYTNDANSRILKSNNIQVVPKQKIPYKLQAYEGKDTVNTHIILKWSLDNKPFVTIPPEYYFLPDLSM